MHSIEPFYNWKLYYDSESDEKSPYFEQNYNQFVFTKTIYNYYIHPQWDSFESATLYLKIIFVNYKKHIAIIELIGEWNDAIENDIMKFKHNIIDTLLCQQICKFILISEYVLNFFKSDDEYYLEWQDDVLEKNGWISIVNMPEQSKYEFASIASSACINILNIENWRTLTPEHFILNVQKKIKDNN